MTTRSFWSLVDATDAELERDLRGLIAAGCRTEARIVAHLAELDARRLSLIRGRSLFEYCQVELGLSESQAFYRITAARTARKFPIVFDLLERQEIHLTTIALISKYLTHENHLELLEEAHGKSKRKVLELLARRFPKADVASQILVVPAGAVAAGPTGTLEPRSAQSYRLQLNASEPLVAKLELARDLMSHANPSGDLAFVVERALDVLIEKLKQRRFGQTLPPKTNVERRSCVALKRKSPALPPTLSSVARDDEQRMDCNGRRRRVAWSSSRSTEAVSHAEVTFLQCPEKCSPDDSYPALGDGSDPVDQSRYTTLPIGPANTAQDIGRPKRSRRHIPNEVRRQVVERDGHRCTFQAEDGQRCMARAFLQIHHNRAWAKGGAETFSNLRLLCASHNRLRGEQEFGSRPGPRAPEHEAETRLRRARKTS